MRALRRSVAGLAVALALTAAGGGVAGAQEPAATVGANGNAFLGGLSFTPADVTVAVGDTVVWTNTDFLVPHTSTEDHGLWDLTGNYGATPVSPPGYGPGAVVARAFEAGTHRYFCLVHPEDMKGSVAVAPGVSATRTTTRRRVRVRTRRGTVVRIRRRTVATIAMRWAAAPPAEGQAFDVERRTGGGEWQRLHTATTAGEGTFRTRPGTPWEIRARLRDAADEERATDWSPPAPVTG